MMRGLSGNEKRILELVTSEPEISVPEIASRTGLDERSARRLYNRLFVDNACSKAIIPNYALLGFKVMIVQRFSLKNDSLPDIDLLIAKILSSWPNCIDCHATFDGRILMRTVWKSPEEFTNSRTVFHNRFGMDWLEGEDLDMVPLEPNKAFVNFTGFKIFRGDSSGPD